MAISYVNAASAAAATLTMPTGIVAGDMILVWAHRTATTAPSLATGYVNLMNGSGNSNSYRCAYKFATGTESGTALPTFTNATEVIVQVYRGVAGIGVQGSATAAASTTATFIAKTLQNLDGTSWFVVFAGSSQATSMSTPTGTTLRASQTGTTRFSIGIDTNAGVSTWAAHTSTQGSSAVYSYAELELIPANTTVPSFLRQSNYNTATSTIAFSTTPVLGNILLYACTIFATTDPGAPTDNYGNTWANAAFAYDSSGTNVCTLYWTRVTATGTGFTVTPKDGSASNAIAEISGYGAIGATAIPTGVNTQPTGTITTTKSSSPIAVLIFNEGSTSNPQATYTDEYMAQKQINNSTSERMVFAFTTGPATAGAKTVGLTGGYTTAQAWAIAAAEMIPYVAPTIPTNLFFF